MPHAASRTEFKHLIALALIAVIASGCTPKSFLYVGSSVPAIEIFDKTPGLNGVPQLVRKPGTMLASTIGSPEAMAVVDKSLYVAGGSGSVAQYTIDPASGALTLRTTVPAGSPPHSIAATRTTVYVANHGSNSISVYAIDAAGNLSNVQTASATGVSSLQVDGAGKFLFTGNRASGAAGAQVCSHTLQADGTPGAAPNCVAVGGAPVKMQVSGGVLFLLFNASVPPSLGNTNWLSAWSIDPASGALTHRGADLDIGAANTGGMAVSGNGQTLYLPRQGGFMSVSTADPLTSAMITFPQAAGQMCLLPPPGAGEVLADPGGKAIFITDPLGATSGNFIGPRVSLLEIVAGGGLKGIACDTAGRLPQSMAMFNP